MRLLRPIAVAVLVGASIQPAAGAAARPPAKQERPLLTTGITGRAAGTGLDDPQFVLSHLPVQRLILAATAGPLKRADAESRLEGTPVTLGILVRLGLISCQGGGCRLAYSVLTVEDQERIAAVTRRFGRDLAGRFRARRAELDELLSLYRRKDLRDELAFGIVAGMVLNWDGLRQASRLGLRVDPRSLPGERSYFVHSEEIGAELPSEGLYSGSHTFPGPEISLSTFGDGASLPRMRGLPDALSGPVERGLTVLDGIPGLRGAVQRVLVPHLVEALVEAGAVMEALAGASLTREQMAGRIDVSPDRLPGMLDLLEAIEYVSVEEGRYSASVPVLTAGDEKLVDGVADLGSRILAEWLEANHDRLEAELEGLTPLRNGLPFEVVFNEVWHFTFGWATRFLAEEGYYANPRSPDSARPGFVPLVWASSLHAGPGSGRPVPLSPVW